MSEIRPLALYGVALEPGTTLIEASAGTGKTFSMAQLVVRLLVEADIPLPQILVVTFTRAAAAELRERIFERLRQVRQALDGVAAGEDAAFDDWIASLPDRNGARRRVERAMLSLDQAPILTIDGFTARVLRQHALSLGLASDAELVEDERPLRDRLVAQRWLAINEVPDVLRRVLLARFPDVEALWRQLRSWSCEARFEPKPPAVEDMLARLDEKAPFDLLADHLEGMWNEGAFYKSKPRSPHLDSLPAGLLGRLCEALRAGGSDLPAEVDGCNLHEWLSRRLRLDCQLPLNDELVQYCQLQICLRRQLVSAWLAETHRWLCERLEQQLDEQGAYTHASLKRRLAEAIGRDEAFAERLRQDYLACLVDEFQDTDADQWRIFSTLFQHPDRHLYLIGDPKQAIYRFRGANLAVYFSAAASADRRFHLTTNYRSDQKLLEAVNRLFGPRENADAFCHEALAYVPVEAPKRRRLPIERDGQLIDTPFEWAWTRSEANRTGTGQILRQLQRDVVSALTRFSIEGMPLTPGQIAVLVGSNEQGVKVQQALREVNVPSVFSVRSSVWRSEAAEALAQLLHLLLAPTDGGKLRAVLISPLFGWTLKDLVDASRFNEAMEVVEAAAERWSRQGVLAAVEGLLDELDGWTALAGLENGERWLTDLRHLLELLQQWQRSHKAPPQALLNHLLEQLHHARDEEAQLRLERDEDAVQIVTMHKSKGLQYPVVFCPFLGGKDDCRDCEGPIVRVDDETGQKLLWQGDRAEIELAELQHRQERLRLAYVALTRAERYVKVYWDIHTTKSRGTSWSPLGWLVARSNWNAIRETDLGEWIDPDQPDAALWQGGGEPAPLVKPELPRRNVATRQLASYSSLAGADEPDPLEAADDGLPRGAAFGSWLHAVLEHLSFQQMDSLNEDVVRQAGVPFGFGDREAALYRQLLDLIHRVVHAPLDPVPLATLKDGQTLREMHFVLSIGQLSADWLNERLAEAPWWRPVAFDTLKGYLQGYVDLIFEHAGRFYIADYKSNLLPDYDEPTLAQAMAQHHYGLQALFYTVALHRHLRQRMGDAYDYDRHMGGVCYLFVRGMGRTGEGVFRLDFERELIEALDEVMGWGDEPE